MQEFRGKKYSTREISELPILRIEHGVCWVELPDGSHAFCAPRHSENGRGWWDGDYRVYYLFETFREAYNELKRENALTTEVNDYY